MKGILYIFAPLLSAVLHVVFTTYIGETAGNIAFGISLPILLVVAFALIDGDSLDVSDMYANEEDDTSGLEDLEQENLVNTILDEDGNLNIDSTEYYETRFYDD